VAYKGQSSKLCTITYSALKKPSLLMQQTTKSIASHEPDFQCRLKKKAPSAEAVLH